MAVRKKLKIRKKNFTIFILIVIIIITGLSFGIKNLISFISNNKEVTIISKRNKKLQELNNIDKKISYFDNHNIDRYLKYKDKFKDLNLEDVITRVNLNLDYTYYTNTKPADNLNTTYILVNKYNYLSEDYIPNNLENISSEYARSGMKLVKEAKDAFENLASDALKENLIIRVTSSYRSYKYQTLLYNDYKESDGEEKADAYSARPGFSEHQTGLCIDVNTEDEDYNDFGNTKEFLWMEDNAYKYGFILRYPKEKDNITGYTFETWHYRYVGKEIAQYIKKHNITFDEYYVRKIKKY